MLDVTNSPRFRTATYARWTAGIALALFATGCGGDDSSTGFVSTGTSEGGTDSSPLAEGGHEAAPADAYVPDAAPPNDAMLQDAPPEGGTAWDPDAIPEAPAVFVDGIQVGGTTDSSAIFWSRIAQSISLHLVVWEQVAPGEVLIHSDVVVQPDAHGFIRRELDDLAPWTTYRWAFFAEDGVGDLVVRSAIGRLKTAPEQNSLPTIVFAGTHGTHYSHLPLEVLAANADHEIDFFLHLGDSSYNDDADTVEDFRERYSFMWRDPGFRAVFGHTTYYAVWDDHEVGNDWDPETIDPGRMDAAFQAYFEYNATPRFPAAPHRIWTKYRWGKTAELYLLDCRSERKPSTRNGPDAQYISPEQLAWLQDELLASDAVFKLIANSVPITNFPLVFDLKAQDRWEGYAAQREKLLNFIVDNDIHGVVWLSGDFHFGSIQQLEADGPWSHMVEILMGPGGSNRNPLGNLLDNTPGFYFGRDKDMVTLIELDPNVPNMRVEFRNEYGAPYVSRNFPGGEAPP